MDTQRFAAVRVGDADVDVTVDISIFSRWRRIRGCIITLSTEMDDHARMVMEQRRTGRRVTGIGRGLLVGLPSAKDATSRIRILSTHRTT
jgi:hypothetical protein